MAWPGSQANELYVYASGEVDASAWCPDTSTDVCVSGKVGTSEWRHETTPVYVSGEEGTAHRSETRTFETGRHRWSSEF
jgi:hypothetical protein